MEELAKAQFAAELAEYGLEVVFRRVVSFDPIGATVCVRGKGKDLRFNTIQFDVFMEGLRISKVESVD